MTKGVDSAEAWIIALASLLVLAISFGSPYVVTTALKSVAADLGGSRAVPSGANALAWLGTGVGGGWLTADSATQRPRSLQTVPPEQSRSARQSWLQAPRRQESPRGQSASSAQAA